MSLVLHAYQSDRKNDRMIEFLLKHSGLLNEKQKLYVEPGKPVVLGAYSRHHECNTRFYFRIFSSSSSLRYVGKKKKKVKEIIEIML